MKAFRVVMILLIMVFFTGKTFYAETIRERELKRRELNKKYDRLKLREKDNFVVDRSEKFLIEPGEKPAVGEFTVAKVPPTVKLMILPDMAPEYFLEGEPYQAGWASWANVARSPDNRFYFAAGDHRGFGAQVNLYEYCPGRDLVHKVLDVDELLGWTEHSYTDGKIHGHMGIMPDGTLWAATYWGVHPDSSWWANGYRGSWLLSYNIYTHEAKNRGVPLIGNTLPCFRVDTRRGRLVGTGENSTFLSWDCINKKVRYAGYPPNGWNWWSRAMLCDEETGKFWGIHFGSWGVGHEEDAYRFMSFDPEYNRFERFEVYPPENPFTHKVGLPRGHTDRPAMDGWYYWATFNWETEKGAFFRFKPEGTSEHKEPVVEPLGVTWDDGRDVLQMALDPAGRYIYYYPTGSSPIIQYDVKTGKKKVLCWLQEYYFEKYGYWMDCNYGMQISNDGSFLVVCTNGAFQGRGIPYGHPSLVVISIPVEERTHK